MRRGIERASGARRWNGWRALGPVAGVAAAVVTLGSLGAGPSVADDGAVRSESIDLVASLEMHGVMSLQFSSRVPHAYAHTREGGGTVKVLEISDPLRPKLMGQTSAPSGPYMEDMQMGERADGLTFVLVRQDGELVVVDVSKPRAPRLRGRVAASSHTFECVDAACTYAYATWSLQDHLHFDIVDLTDLDRPLVARAAVLSPVGVLHDWHRDGAGVMWALGANGIAAYDASVPASPRLLNTSDINGVKSPLNPYNDRLQLHGAQRPNAAAFRGTADAPSYADGNVLFVSEEGDNADCTDSFQTWFVPSLAGVPATPAGTVGLGTLTPISSWSLLDEPTTIAPDPAFCSVHWFDHHEAGFVALPTYASGTRVLDVRDPANIRQVAYHHTADTMAIQSYWVPERDRSGRITGRKTNLIYTTDVGLVANPFTPTPHASGRLDVFRVDPELLASAN